MAIYCVEMRLKIQKHFLVRCRKFKGISEELEVVEVGRGVEGN